jgi:hypothetical protein
MPPVREKMLEWEGRQLAVGNWAFSPFGSMCKGQMLIVNC